MALFDFGYGGGGLLGGGNDDSMNAYAMDAPQQQTGLFQGFTDRLNSPLVQFGLGLASGGTPQEGFGNALSALQFRQKLAQTNLTGDIKEYQYDMAQRALRGEDRIPFGEWQKTQANLRNQSGLNPFYVQKPDGTIEAYQLNSRGGASKVELPEGAIPAVPNRTVDTGLGTAIVPNRGVPAVPQQGEGTPQGVVIPKNVEGAAAAKKYGADVGQAKFDLPRIEQNAQTALDVIDQLQNHPGKKWAVGATGIIPGIPGTEQKGFVNLFEQAKGKAFMEAYQTLKGGGQITEIEGVKGTQAIARMDRAQNVKDFDKAMDDFKNVIQIGLERARRQAKQQGVPESQSRVRKFNPETGKIE